MMVISQRLISDHGVKAIIYVASKANSALYYLACTYLIVLIVADHFLATPATLVHDSTTTSFVVSPEYTDQLLSHYAVRITELMDRPEKIDKSDRMLATLESSF